MNKVSVRWLSRC